jgi:hypothetical protein
VSEPELIKAETIRKVSVLLERYDRLTRARDALSGDGIAGVYFERPATCSISAEAPVPNAWGEITGERVVDLRKVFKAECQAIEAQLKALGVKP